MTTKTIVIISDTQFPYEDRKAVKAVIDFIGDYAPDEVVQIGDLMDYPQPSRWSRDTAEEYKGSVFEDSEYAKRNFLAPLRNAYDGPVKILEGNHDERPRVYLARYAPALAESRAFDFDVMLDFNGFGIERLPTFYDFAPGWVMTHGHKGGIKLRQSAITTSVLAAEKFGKSVIMGHTHRLGVGSITKGYDANATVYTGMEVGNLMDMRLAQYLKGGTGNWQQGFGLAFVDEAHVAAVPVRIDNKRFVVQGTTYKW